MTVDELRAIPGITHVLFEEVRDLFTVFGNHARINRDAAPSRVLAIVADDSGIADRRFLQDSGEDIFVVRATTDVADVAGVTVTLSPIVHISSRPDEGVSVLSWSHDES
jgi:type II secretory pathway component PulK